MRKKANEKGTCGKGRWEKISHLNQVGTIRWGENEKGGKEKEKEKKKKEKKRKKKEKMSKKLHLLSRIYEDRVVGFRQSKRQSSSTQRELHVGTRNRGFFQTPRGRGFSHTLVIFCLRAI